MKTTMTRQQAKNLGEAFGILAVGTGLALLWFPFFHMIVWIYGWCV